MRICLVTHGFPPHERTGVESYTAALAAALATAGHVVEVFAPRRAEDLPDLSLRRERRHGYGINWLSTNSTPRDQRELLDPPGIAERFDEFLVRERPQVVHFQHVIKLGLGLIERAQERGIPTLYTAHDYYPVCHRFTLLRPDLERCDVLGDSDACSRCDLALSFLNEVPGLGDYQQGALADQLEAQQSEGLRRLLSGGDGPAPFDPDTRAEFARTRARLDERRRAVFGRLDRILSPTRFLADRLVAGGLDRERIGILTYGAETAGLEALARPRGGGPVRFGYLGGMSKHKGVHVLLDAFERLGTDATLALWGDSSDRVYAERMRDRASTVGASWCGPFGREALADCLAEVDVVVVPSIWVENYPFVVREAFAAGRPVVTSDVGALPESVRDGVDGLLFAAGDAEDLARVLRRFSQEDGLLERLVRGIEPVKGIDAQADELLAIYSELVARPSDLVSEELPPNVRPIGRRYAELAALPTRELFRSVLGRLTAVRKMLLDDEPALGELLPAESLAAGSHAQVLLRDLRNECAWLRRSIDTRDRTADALREELRWREGQLDGREREVQWLHGQIEELKRRIADGDTGFESARAENAWLRELVDGIEGEKRTVREEAEWLRELLEGRTEEAEWLRRVVAGTTEEAEWLRNSLVGYEHTIAWQKEKLGALEDALRWHERARADQERWIGRLSELLERSVQDPQRVLGNESQATSPPAPPELDEAHLEAFSERLAEGQRLLEALHAELLERRAEMQRAAADARRGIAGLLLRRTRLGRRVETWDGREGAEERGTP